jgi:hypothetical protein
MVEETLGEQAAENAACRVSLKFKSEAEEFPANCRYLPTF